MPAPEPVSAAEFAAALEALGPFEARPLLAVAVSGGPDSLALARLAADWARARRGRVVALTVDHGLRPGSAAEARRVGRWMKRAGIAHAILRWTGPKPRANIQALARDARYRLLSEACRRRGALHLLLGHQRDDQAETVLLRRARGSGPIGLAAMAPIAERAAIRLLRPLLGFPRARLEATLRARGQGWIDDPANRDPRFARARLRAGADALDAAERATLAAEAFRLGRARAEADAALADFLARHARLDAAGFATIDRHALAEAQTDLAARALGALLATVSGAAYPPRHDALVRLVRAIAAGIHAADTLGGGRTLGDCRVAPFGAGRVLIVREARPDKPDLTASLFRLAPAPRGLALARLGRPDKAAKAAARAREIPPLAVATLPALFRPRGARPHEPVIVPALGIDHRRASARRVEIACEFRPRRPLARAPFAARGDDSAIV